MMRSTKKERARILVKVLRDQEGRAKPLGTWLNIFNQELSAKHSLRSTKELAQLFRYLRCVVANSHPSCFTIKKEKVLRSEGVTKIATLFYTFNCNPECPYRNTNKCPQEKIKNE